MNKIFDALKIIFAKFFYILQEMFHLVRKEKLFFLIPIFLILTLLAFLVFYIGPTIIISFIYAGV